MKSWPITSRVLARINLARPATPGMPMVMAGTIMRTSQKPPHPPHGNRSNLRHSSHRTAGILTIMGIDMSTSAVATALGSCQLPCLWARKNPRGSPMPTLTIIAAAFS